MAQPAWGASIGKAICHLRVVGPDRSAPGFSRALVRAVFGPRACGSFGGALAWSPMLLAPVLVVMLKPLAGMFWAGTLVGALIIGLAVLSRALRQRNLQDRLAGTWLAPR